jgi:hypothetical protein
MTNRYEIAANCEIAGLAGKSVKLSAQEQREIFGAYVFGKQTLIISLENQGGVTAQKMSYPIDTLFHTWTLAEVAEAVNAGKKLQIN